MNDVIYAHLTTTDKFNFEGGDWIILESHSDTINKLKYPEEEYPDEYSVVYEVLAGLAVDFFSKQWRKLQPGDDESSDPDDWDDIFYYSFPSDQKREVAGQLARRNAVIIAEPGKI